MTVTLILANIAVFAWEAVDPDRAVALFALWPLQSHAMGGPPFHLWQVLTYSMLHANAGHLALNMFGLYMFGRDVERTLGGKRWCALYLASILSGALVQLVVSLAHAGDAYPTVGASAGVFGVLVAYALFFPHLRVVLLFPPVPMPAWLFATIYALLELLLGMSGNEPDVAHFAHLGGMLGALVLVLHWARIVRQHRID
ncbi:rhomboid family intramembrane serine protease [Caballeronia sp. AZ1_KS37]|uniref:rhomboid family intramembrane serine protease n=1 Tax=Caballeronia sp. AZ1_KS37 TaxID=2921756 RepID=UPI0020280B64|nr:rhomboid family intramembrane serine protease [Caballeronia sp. AZ1_KS37]